MVLQLVPLCGDVSHLSWLSQSIKQIQGANTEAMDQLTAQPLRFRLQTLTLSMPNPLNQIGLTRWDRNKR